MNENSWNSSYKTAVYSFVTVNEETKALDIKSRNIFKKYTALRGASLTKCLIREVERILHRMGD